MSVFIITCPNSGRAVSTGVEAVDDVLPVIARKGATMRCPVCGEVHAWTPAGARIGEEPTPETSAAKTAA